MIGVERGRIDVALLGQDGLQRAHAQLRLGQLRAVLVVVIVLVAMGKPHCALCRIGRRDARMIAVSSAARDRSREWLDADSERIAQAARDGYRLADCSQGGEPRD